MRAIEELSNELTGVIHGDVIGTPAVGLKYQPGYRGHGVQKLHLKSVAFHFSSIPIGSGRPSRGGRRTGAHVIPP
ncbi:hypothetical protein [Arthrobacter sp. M2012083]|uniref:hypothetical protein n=1 Tax=Arthrobacter sp. M2012083 TaxID=1197706 RepID=UPI000305A7C7|nr:hypothetical protein [Arthrobacter sp. M2012083]